MIEEWRAKGLIKPCQYCGTHNDRHGRRLKNRKSVVKHEMWCRENEQKERIKKAK